MLIDPLAQTYQLHPCLLIPIGAKDKRAIEKYIGTIDVIIGDSDAFIVNVEPLSPPNDLLVWKHPRSKCLIDPMQIWVDIDFNGYRDIYMQYCKDIDQMDVIDHIMNRKFARKLGYRYVRLLHVYRAVNSSAGRGGESMANDNINTYDVDPEFCKNEIEYADPMDLCKMLNIKVGGFALDGVRDNQYLFY
jgi:hypothetical protein